MNTTRLVGLVVPLTCALAFSVAKGDATVSSDTTDYYQLRKAQEMALRDAARAQAEEARIAAQAQAQRVAAKAQEEAFAARKQEEKARGQEQERQRDQERRAFLQWQIDEAKRLSQNATSGGTTPAPTLTATDPPMNAVQLEIERQRQLAAEAQRNRTR